MSGASGIDSPAEKMTRRIIAASASLAAVYLCHREACEFAQEHFTTSLSSSAELNQLNQGLVCADPVGGLILILILSRSRNGGVRALL
jgi:hypothetical protein